MLRTTFTISRYHPSFQRISVSHNSLSPTFSSLKYLRIMLFLIKFINYSLVIPFLLVPTAFQSSITLEIISPPIQFKFANCHNLFFLLFQECLLDIQNFYNIYNYNLSFLNFLAASLPTFISVDNNVFILCISNVQVSAPYNMTRFISYLKTINPIYSGNRRCN